VGNLLFSISLIALVALAILTSRSMARFSVLTLFTVTISGAILQFLSEYSLPVNLSLIQWWLVATGVVLVALAYSFGRMGGAIPMWKKASNMLLLVSSGLIAVAFLVSRLLAPGDLAPLSSVGFFVAKVSAEDNAKWLNATSQLANSTTIDTWANVGGPLLLVMSFGATLIGALSYLLYGSVNEVAVSAGSVIFTQVFFVIISPFALAPIVEKTYRKLTGGAQLPRLYLLLSVAILVASTTVLIDYGHITLQFTLIALTLWIGTFLAPIRKFPARLLTTLSVVALSMVWFPLAGLSLVIVVGALAYFLRGILRKSDESRRSAAIGLVSTIAVFVVTIQFLLSALRYSLGVDSVDASAGGIGTGIVGGVAAAVRAIGAPTLPLFDDPGGTEALTTLLLVLTLISVLGLVWVRLGGAPLRRSQAVAFLPIILAGGYALAIAFADFWAVGSGPNYGSLKVSFAVFLPIFVASLPFALTTFHRGRSRIDALGLSGVAVIVVVLTLDTLLPRAVLQLKPTNWPGVEQSPYWYPAEVRDTGDQALATNPIGCVFLPRGAEQPSVLPAGQTMYTCSRLLAGVAGVEILTAPIVKWQLDEWLQNRELWSEMHPYFSGMPPEIVSRQFILLDTDKRVIGLESLSGLLKRFPPLES
jgi:hypothetical protein